MKWGSIMRWTRPRARHSLDRNNTTGSNINTTESNIGQKLELSWFQKRRLNEEKTTKYTTSGKKNINYTAKLYPIYAVGDIGVQRRNKNSLRIKSKIS